MNARPKVLFLCTGNSCRSPMAEGWARKLKARQMEAFSAGVAPGRVDLRAVRVMAEAGVDISRQQSKHVDELGDVRFDWVVTLCGHARETCPVFPGATRVMHHGFEDPLALAGQGAAEAEIMQIYRRVRDEIRAFVETLPESLEQKADEG